MPCYCPEEKEAELTRLRALEKEAEKYRDLVAPEVPCFAKHLKKPRSLRPTALELREYTGFQVPTAAAMNKAAIFLLERLYEEGWVNQKRGDSLHATLERWIDAYRKELEE
jgi:hypothetical protein